MNISEEVIRTCDVLKKGGVILYPTDTIWGIGCDASNANAINRVYEIKKRRLSKSLLILLDEPEKLSLYTEHIPVIAWDLINQASTPTTFIYPHIKNLPRNLVSSDGSIGIRITSNEFCRKVISLLGHPIVSTSANISGKPTPTHFREISQEIKGQMDYIVDPSLGTVQNMKASTIIRFTDDYSFEIIRE
ncbi:MAG: threonylcarbamoyl-AMP synthase [Bacteroidales bacterium]|nr:threonylcarbamoyl-AMP synthase [Bacteroidales bacterium]